MTRPDSPVASSLLAGIGRGALDQLASLGRSARFVGRLFRAHEPQWCLVPAHFRRVALPTLGPVLAVAAFIGATATLMAYHAFLPLGTQAMIGSFAGLVILRELAPLLTGAMIGAKPGTSLTATLATMRGSDQIDALEAMAVDPYAFLLWPRAVAFVLAAVPLIVIADATGLLSSYATAITLGISPAAFTSDLLRFVNAGDVGVGILKGVVFSLMSGGIASYEGFFASPGPRGVSTAITRAMVRLAIADVLMNSALSWIFYR